MSEPKPLAKFVDRLITIATILAIPVLAIVAWNTLSAAPQGARNWSHARQRQSLVDSIIHAAPAQAGGATATLIEFVDYECPACRSIDSLVAMLTENSSVRVIVLHYPLESIHARAYGAAKAAVCAERAGAFIPFHRALFREGLPASDSGYVRIARAVGVGDSLEFESCRNGRSADSVIAKHANIAFRLGVGGTPTFFDAKGQVVSLSKFLTASIGGD